MDFTTDARYIIGEGLGVGQFAGIRWGRTDNSMNLGTNSNQNNITISTLGDVGINQTTPVYLLDLAGTRAAVRFTPHDNTLVNTEGLLFADDSENRLKYHDGSQLRSILLKGDETTAYTPSSTADPAGDQGDVAYDDNYIYVKTSTGWKRAALLTF